MADTDSGVGVMDEMAQVCVLKATADTLDTGPWMPSRLGLIFLHPVQQAQEVQGLVPTWVSSLCIIKLGRKRKGSSSRSCPSNNARPFSPSSLSFSLYLTSPSLSP